VRHGAPGIRSTRALQVVWITLVGLAVARVVLAFVPSMYCWGLNLQRFLPPLEGWGLWALSTLALVPALARRLEPWAVRAGDGMAGTPALPYVLFAVTGLLVGVLPDQLHFVGDFLLRLGAAKNNIPVATLFPQAQPLDLLLHHALPEQLATAFASDALTAERVIGALEAAVFAVLAVAFVRALELRGAGAFAAGAVVLLGGTLGLFTGYGKSIREICILILAAAVFGLQVARSGRGLVALGLSTAAALTLHRSALALLVPFVVALVLGFRHYGREGGWRRAPAIVAVAIPLGTLALIGPHIAAVIRRADVLHVAPAGAPIPHIIAVALGGEHLRELANLLLLLSPVCVPGIVAVAVCGPRRWKQPEGLVLLSLAASFAVPLFFVHPQQGMFRDWDVFSPAAVGITMVAAWSLGRTLESATGRTGLGMALALAAFVPTTQWLLQNHELRPGLSRVRAFLEEPPARSDQDRTLAWDFLGTRMSWLDSLDAAADAYRHAATITPTPRMLYNWAHAEAARGNYQASRDVLLTLTARADTWPDAWAALALVSQQLGDTVRARASAQRALGLNPRDEMARDVIKAIETGVATRPRPARVYAP